MVWSIILRSRSEVQIDPMCWYGLMVGIAMNSANRLPHSIIELNCFSRGWLAELASQNSSSRSAASCGLPSSRADQANVAQIAPPEVPLSPTISWSARTSGCRKRERTPAVKAVWLPPP